MGFYLIRFAYHNKVFMIHSLDMHNIIDTIGKKSVKYEYCLKDDRFIELDSEMLNFEDYILVENIMED